MRGEYVADDTLARSGSSSARVALSIAGAKRCARDSTITCTDGARSSRARSAGASGQVATLRRCTRASSMRRSLSFATSVAAPHGVESQASHTDTGCSFGAGGAPRRANDTVSIITSVAVTAPACARRPRSTSIVMESTTHPGRHDAASKACTAATGRVSRWALAAVSGVAMSAVTTPASAAGRAGRRRIVMPHGRSNAGWSQARRAAPCHVPVTCRRECASRGVRPWWPRPHRASAPRAPPNAPRP